MNSARDLILEFVEERCFEGHYDKLDGAGVAYREWWECVECNEQATDIELIDHDSTCFVSKVEDLILDSYTT